MNYKDSTDQLNFWKSRLQNESQSGPSNNIIIDLLTFNTIHSLLKERNYQELILNLKQMRIFCKNSNISEFPENYDFILFLSDCISITDPEKVMIGALKLLKKLFVQSFFVECFNKSPSNEILLSQLSSLFTQDQNSEILVHIFEIFINLSGGTIQERDLAIQYIPFDTLFQILESEDKDQNIKYYASRLIHNYCRQEIDVETGKRVMIEYCQIFHKNISTNVKIELNWTINHLGSSMKIDWIKTIKRNEMFPLFFEGLVNDNPNLAISSLYIIFQIIEDWKEPLRIEPQYIDSLLSDSNNNENIMIGCYCVRHLIKLQENKALIAKELIKFGIFDKIMNVYQISSFQCKEDAMFALCAFAESDLTENFGIFFENNFVTLFLDFFMAPIVFELKIEMINSLFTIFQKARINGSDDLEKIKFEFLQNDGIEIFESLKDDENDIDGELATKVDMFLSEYIDEE